MSNHYKLVNGEPVKCDLMEWAEFFTEDNMRIAKDEIGDVNISTVFLGLDHQYGDGPPLLYETMIFGGEHDGYQERYSTEEQAKRGHKKACEMVEA